MSDEGLNERLPDDWLSRGRTAPRHVPTLTEVLELPDAGNAGATAVLDSAAALDVPSPDRQPALDPTALLTPDPSPAPRADPAPWDEDLAGPESEVAAGLAPLPVETQPTDAGMAFELRLDLPAEPEQVVLAPLDLLGASDSALQSGALDAITPEAMGVLPLAVESLALLTEPEAAAPMASASLDSSMNAETGGEGASGAAPSAAADALEMVFEADELDPPTEALVAQLHEPPPEVAQSLEPSVLPSAADEGPVSHADAELVGTTALDALLQEALQRAMPGMVSLLREEIRALLLEQQASADRTSH